MPIGMQALFSQKYPWKIGAGPEFAMVVGPTIAVPLAKRFAQDTEKYAGQTRLRKVDTGGYTVDGYVAGVPFPEPSGGDLIGYQIMYNAFYGFIPPVYRYTTNSHLVDRFLNEFPQSTEVVYWRLSHISDPDMPVNPDYGKGHLQTARYFVLAPEQTRYTTQLSMQPDDPEKVQEIYVFLPSLRRSLRLSSAARCSPILGTDWVQDDNSDGMAFQIPEFARELPGREEDSRHGSCQKPRALRRPQLPDEEFRAGMADFQGGLRGSCATSMVVDVSPLPAIGNILLQPQESAYIDTADLDSARFRLLRQQSASFGR